MDETKKAEQDSLQEHGKAPTSEDGNTPEPEVYNKTQLEEAIQKDRIQRGRDAKTFEQRESAVKAKEDAQAEQDKQRDATELAEAQKDPDLLAIYQKKQADKQRGKSLDEREAVIARSEADHEAEITAARETQKEITIISVASAKNIDPMRLKTLSEKFSVEGKEKLEELAGEIASGKTGNFEADNAMTKGVRQDWHELSPDEKIRRGTTSKK